MKKRARIVIGCCLCALTLGSVGTGVIIHQVNASKENRQYQYWLSFDTNGGNQIDDILYVNGDYFKLPEAKKTGYIFGGWYLDNETFEDPFYAGSSVVSKNITLYAKWVIKPIKVYFDTANENEFEPLTFNVGDTFHVSSLPTNVKEKKLNNILFSFTKWLDGGENPITEDFIIQDQYYAFHASYGAPAFDKYDLAYQSDFNTDYGYIDPNHSWDRGEFLLPATGVGQSDPIQDVYVEDGELCLSQLRHLNQGYGAKILLPHEYTENLKSYSISTEFRITDILTPNSAAVNKNDIGFGIMVGFDKQTGAHVEAVVDAYSRLVRISACNNAYAKSSWDSVTQKFAYSIPGSFDFNQYHTLKVKYNGVTPSTASTLNASYVYVYLDGVEVWNTKDVLLNKNWFYEGQACGDYIGLSASLVKGRVKNVTLKNYEETEIIYSYDFSSHAADKFADGWFAAEKSKGSSVGKVEIKDGKLNINTYFKKQTLLKNQIIYSPCEKLKNFMVDLDFQFNAYYAADKYFAIVFRGLDDNTYNAYIVRAENGQTQIYKHGVNNMFFSDWGSAYGVKTVTGGFKKDPHHMSMLLKDNLLVVYLDGNEIYSGFMTENAFYNRSGYIGLLTSSADVSFDNVAIYNLDKEAN